MYKHLIGVSDEEGETLLSDAQWWGKSQWAKINIQEALSALKKKLSYCEGGQILGQDAQRGCGVCVLR